jgi:hemoglobin
VSEHPTLHAWAGGDTAFRRLIDAFYDRVERDDLLSSFFPGGVSEEHRAHVTRWWIEVFGGASTYTDELGGYENMLAHHRGLGIKPDQRLRFATLMSMAADDAALPDDPEFRAAFMGYVEWGTRLALHNSQPDAPVVEHVPGAALGMGRGTALPASRTRLIGPPQSNTDQQMLLRNRWSSSTSSRIASGSCARCQQHSRRPTASASPAGAAACAALIAYAAAPSSCAATCATTAAWPAANAA